MKTYDKFKIYLIPFLLIIYGVLFPGCQKNTQNKLYTVGIISLTPRHDQIIEGFKTGMKKHGYKEGSNIRYIYNGPIKDKSKLGPAIKEMMNHNIDLLFTATTAATKAANVTKDKNIPLVFAPVFDPVKSGIVKSIANHDCNITGVKVGGSTAKALEYLIAIAPRTGNIFVPTDEIKVAKQSLGALKQGAKKLGVELTISPVATKQELHKVLAGIPNDIDAIWVLNSPFLVSNINAYIEAAINNKIPVASGTSQYKSGVLISYGQNHFRTGEQASRLADKILQGTRPADLPIETTDFVLGINLKTAGEIGIKIPEHVLQQADFIIR